MQEEIYDQIWKLSPFVNVPDAYTALKKCTSQLISLYHEQGRILDDPFEPVRHRTLDLPVESLEDMLRDSTCVVTGGLGCVGSRLVDELLRFNVRRIVILDIHDPQQLICCPDRLVHFHCDVANLPLLEKIFRFYRPDYVFHTAGQRDPGQAEVQVADTLRTNIIGTFNIVSACEATGVKQCVLASTGKASRYFTEEVYAASKKICEYIFDTAAKTSAVRYSMVRFTHILDNSIMNQQLAYESRHEPFISLHCPAKYVTAQNAGEAAYLLLNALIFSEKGQCKFLIVKNLAWPVESLEVALYHLKQSGRSVPIVFKGNPKGYSERFFRGQLNWAKPDELNLLLNVYEHRFSAISPSHDMIISSIVPPDQRLLNDLMNNLRVAIGDHACREVLINGLQKIVEDTLTRVPEEDTLNILHWGLEKEFLNGNTHADFNSITSLMFNSLKSVTHHHEEDHLWGGELFASGYRAP